MTYFRWQIFIVRGHIIINGREVLCSTIGTLQYFTYLRVIYLETSNILRRHKDQNVSAGLLGQPGILAVSQSRWCRPNLAELDPKTVGFKNVEMDWTQVRYKLASWMRQNEHRQGPLRVVLCKLLLLLCSIS